ncbi:ArsR/SmtB family transcription factor [Metabacillus halosaccharovorans]|uniref:Winged helix-turn-helix transcriptional regulator n=1 Tax=Metabacillus halosaccharovorans TaxID=930124 RepID=A0ABT3DB79_9BACI|nr:winged helix-turn-helix transcriptional regulator [Metabacillus halosaccharovorans]MCV9884298.1 winged helix-turn-helix transcriptional regulator [Metabacillus halosaccharovorans]
MIHIKDLRSGLTIFKALSSETRIEIINLLRQHDRLNLNELAEKLKLTNGAVTMHIKKLEESGIIDITTTVGKHGIQKMCYLNEDSLTVDLRSKEIEHCYEYEINVGHYINYSAEPTCGLATKNSIIGEFDDPRYFADPSHIHAGIIWLNNGFLEYRIPNYLKRFEEFKELQFIFEISSEAPGYNEDWPSDIYFYLNNIELGFWTSPGDFGKMRGTNNPDWWPGYLNQYGMAKLLRINKDGTFIDGSRISDVTIDHINLTMKSEIKFKLAVSDNRKNSGGLTLFGKDFGHFNHEIIARVLYDVIK